MSPPLPPFLLPRPRASEVWPGHCLGQGSSRWNVAAPVCASLTICGCRRITSVLGCQSSKLASVGAPSFAHVHCAGAAAAVRSARPAVPVGA
eukprot:5452450-Prymnesium_polylepis.1